MEEKSSTNLQKFKWRKHKIFKDYESAKKEKDSLLKDNEKVKIRRCGDRGSLFKVVIGSPLVKGKSLKGKNKWIFLQ